MPQRTGCSFHAWHTPGTGVFLKATAGLSVSVEYLSRKETSIGKGQVESRRCVTFTENKPIPIRITGILGVNCQNRPISRHQDVYARKRRSQVRGARPVRYLDELAANVARDRFQFTEVRS